MKFTPPVTSLMIIIFLVGCGKPAPTPSPDQMDRSIFTGIPCATPCWQNLLVGKSTWSEVKSTIDTLNFIGSYTIQADGISGISVNPNNIPLNAVITAQCKIPQNKCLTIWISEGILSKIQIEFNYKMNLEMAVQYLDNPDFVLYRMMSPEDQHCEVQLIWKSKQLILVSELTKYCAATHTTDEYLTDLSFEKAQVVTMANILQLFQYGFPYK
jgi:hypothetical protein